MIAHGVCSSVAKESACSAEDPGSIPGLGRSPGEVHGNPLQYSSLENSMDRGAWWVTVHEIAESNKTEQLTLFSKVVSSPDLQERISIRATLT